MPEVIFTGPEGRIEGRYHPSDRKAAPIAIVLHPHPLYGGTMNNKVVYNIYHSLARHGFSVLRFNFRGVGRSQGKFDDGNGELTDAASALDWIQLMNPEASTCWVAGFSFGAWIGMQLMMRRPEIEGFISVSPPAQLYDFSFLSPCPASGMILQGEKDEIVAEEAVSALAGKLASQRGVKIDYRVVSSADHYFRTTLDQVTVNLEDYIGKRMQEFTQRKRSKPDRKRRQLPRA